MKWTKTRIGCFGLGITGLLLAGFIYLNLPDFFFLRVPYTYQLRHLEMAIQNYKAEHNYYPSPVPIERYLDESLIDILGIQGETVLPVEEDGMRYYDYSFREFDLPFVYHAYDDAFTTRTGVAWVAVISGADDDFDLKPMADAFLIENLPVSAPYLIDKLYDPTNGSGSSGDYIRLSGRSMLDLIEENENAWQ
ncbi:MAG: hypothetical protein RLY93_05720 [Sumerlaeia bacterium]